MQKRATLAVLAVLASLRETDLTPRRKAAKVAKNNRAVRSRTPAQSAIDEKDYRKSGTIATGGAAPTTRPATISRCGAKELSGRRATLYTPERTTRASACWPWATRAWRSWWRAFTTRGAQGRVRRRCGRRRSRCRKRRADSRPTTGLLSSSRANRSEV